MILFVKEFFGRSVNSKKKVYEKVSRPFFENICTKILTLMYFKSHLNIHINTHELLLKKAMDLKKKKIIKEERLRDIFFMILLDRQFAHILSSYGD